MRGSIFKGGSFFFPCEGMRVFWCDDLGFIDG